MLKFVKLTLKFMTYQFETFDFSKVQQGTGKEKKILTSYHQVRKWIDRQ